MNLEQKLQELKRRDSLAKPEAARSAARANINKARCQRESAPNSCSTKAYFQSAPAKALGIDLV
jgi:hypothetical protein